jgi:hypothetical protein
MMQCLSYKAKKVDRLQGSYTSTEVYKGSDNQTEY